MVHETARVLFDVELSKATPETRQGFVYFLRFHERVKIGFTTDIRGRFKAIPHDEVLGWVPGTRLDERRCHEAFAHLRETGEWFRAEPDLLGFIAGVDVHGDLGAA